LAGIAGVPVAGYLGDVANLPDDAPPNWMAAEWGAAEQLHPLLLKPLLLYVEPQEGEEANFEIAYPPRATPCVDGTSSRHGNFVAADRRSWKIPRSPPGPSAFWVCDADYSAFVWNYEEAPTKRLLIAQGWTVLPRPRSFREAKAYCAAWLCSPPNEVSAPCAACFLPIRRADVPDGEFFRVLEPYLEGGESATGTSAFARVAAGERRVSAEEAKAALRALYGDSFDEMLRRFRSLSAFEAAGLLKDLDATSVFVSGFPVHAENGEVPVERKTPSFEVPGGTRLPVEVKGTGVVVYVPDETRVSGDDAWSAPATVAASRYAAVDVDVPSVRLERHDFRSLGFIQALNARRASGTLPSEEQGPCTVSASRVLVPPDGKCTIFVQCEGDDEDPQEVSDACRACANAFAIADACDGRKKVPASEDLEIVDGGPHIPAAWTCPSEARILGVKVEVVEGSRLKLVDRAEGVVIQTPFALSRPLLQAYAWAPFSDLPSQLRTGLRAFLSSHVPYGRNTGSIHPQSAELARAARGANPAPGRLTFKQAPTQVSVAACYPWSSSLFNTVPDDWKGYSTVEFWAFWTHECSTFPEKRDGDACRTTLTREEAITLDDAGITWGWSGPLRETLLALRETLGGGDEGQSSSKPLAPRVRLPLPKSGVKFSSGVGAGAGAGAGTSDDPDDGDDDPLPFPLPPKIVHGVRGNGRGGGASGRGGFGRGALLTPSELRDSRSEGGGSNASAPARRRTEAEAEDEEDAPTRAAPSRGRSEARGAPASRAASAAPEIPSGGEASEEASRAFFTVALGSGLSMGEFRTLVDTCAQVSNGARSLSSLLGVSQKMCQLVLSAGQRAPSVSEGASSKEPRGRATSKKPPMAVPAGVLAMSRTSDGVYYLCAETSRINQVAETMPISGGTRPFRLRTYARISVVALQGRAAKDEATAILEEADPSDADKASGPYLKGEVADALTASLRAAGFRPDLRGRGRSRSKSTRRRAVLEGAPPPTEAAEPRETARRRARN